MKLAAKYEQADDLSWSGSVDFEDGIAVASGATLEEVRENLKSAVLFALEDPEGKAFEQIGETLEVDVA